MSERRCDLHGPYSPEEAAAIVLGARPPQTGYLCPACQAGIAEAAQALSDEIDRRVGEAAYGSWEGRSES